MKSFNKIIHSIEYAGHVRQTSDDVRQRTQTLLDIFFPGGFNTHKMSVKKNKNHASAESTAFLNSIKCVAADRENDIF